MTPEEFCRWMQGVIDAVGPGLDMDSRLVSKVSSKLNEVFEHVVEPVAIQQDIGLQKMRC